MSAIIHLSLINEGPQSAVACGNYSSGVHRYSTDFDVANCPDCIKRIAEFIKDFSAVEADHNGDDTRKLEWWVTEASKIVGTEETK